KAAPLISDILDRFILSNLPTGTAVRLGSDRRDGLGKLDRMNRSRISDMSGAAFFDLDRTVVARPSGLAFGRYFYRAGLITRATLLRGYVAQVVYLLRGADEARMEEWRLRGLELARGQHRASFRRVIQSTMDEVIRPIIYREALDLMEWHRARGRRIYLVSSSPEEVVMPIGGLLG